MTPPSAWTLFTLLVVAPVIEELAFRGAVQEWLLRRLDGRAAPHAGWIANGLTALLFAAAHAIHRGVWLGLAVLPAAFLLGWIYHRRRRVGPCILVHAGLNAGWILLACFIPASRLAGF